MQKNSTGYMYMFALVITLGCGVLLAIVSEFTKVDRLTNIKVEKMTNILSTVNYTFDKEATNEEIETAYKQYIEEKVVNTNGEFIEGNAFEIDLKSERKKELADQQLPVFIFTQPETEEKFYVVPLRGNGLWGAVWGYISVESDFQTVYGVKFDHESETPGLGAEITKEWFTEQFKGGKQIFDKDEEVAITILKGKGNELNQYSVDGISGATITGNGVNDMLKNDLTAYKAYFEKSKNS